MFESFVGRCTSTSKSTTTSDRRHPTANLLPIASIPLIRHIDKQLADNHVQRRVERHRQPSGMAMSADRGRLQLGSGWAQLAAAVQRQSCGRPGVPPQRNVKPSAQCRA